jgi:hypothetical protein
MALSYGRQQGTQDDPGDQDQDQQRIDAMGGPPAPPLNPIDNIR